MVRVLFPLPDTDFDTTEVAVPWRILTDAGVECVFATEGGEVAATDPKLLTGVLFGKLGASKEAIGFYHQMLEAAEYQAPLVWSELVVEDYDGLWLAGGHAPGMRQYLGAEGLQAKVAQFWALKRPVAAVCHGPLVLARSKDPETGRSVLDGVQSSGLPKYMERSAFWLTAWRLGRYYRTYPAYVQDEMRAAGVQFVRGPRTLTKKGTMDDDGPAFVVEDGHYLSGRWPGDVYALAKRLRDRVIKVSS